MHTPPAPGTGQAQTLKEWRRKGKPSVYSLLCPKFPHPTLLTMEEPEGKCRSMLKQHGQPHQRQKPVESNLWRKVIKWGCLGMHNGTEGEENLQKYSLGERRGWKSYNVPCAEYHSPNTTKDVTVPGSAHSY